MTLRATCLNSKIPTQFISNNRGGQAYNDAIFATTLPLEVFVFIQTRLIRMQLSMILPLYKVLYKEKGP